MLWFTWKLNSFSFPPHSLTPHSHFMSSWFLLPFYTLLAPTYYFISLCDNVLQKVEIPLVFIVRHRFCCCCWLSLPTREKNAMMMISLCAESFSFVARAAHRRAEKYDDDEELEARLVCFMWFSQFPLVSLFYVYLQHTKHSANSHFAPIPPDLNSSSSIDDELWFKVFSGFFLLFSRLFHNAIIIISPTSSSRGKTYSTLFLLFSFSSLSIVHTQSRTSSFHSANESMSGIPLACLQLSVVCTCRHRERLCVIRNGKKYIERMKSKVLSEESNYGIHSLVYSLSTLPSSSSSGRHTMLLRSEWKGGKSFDVPVALFHICWCALTMIYTRPT